MRNMLEEYYEFLCKRLISWTSNVEIAPGDRYVLSFEERQQVRNFISVLSKMSEVENIRIGNSDATLSGLAIKSQKNNTKLIVVSTENMTPDYLVNLRNRVSEQQGIWTNTALLFISNQILDSINSGAKDISRKGGPFNLHELRKNMHKEIENSASLSEKEKIILKVMIQSFFQGAQIYTLMDFAEIYAIIEQGHIEKKNYTELGYFQDLSLLTYSEDEIESRLSDNRNDFEQIRMLRSLSDIKGEIGKMVDGEALINALSSENWDDVDYGDILAGKDKLDRSRKKIDYLSDKVSEINVGYKIWDQPKKLTAAGKRNRQIIVFNANKESSISVRLPFDSILNRKNLNSKMKDSKNPKITVSKQRLEVQFDNLRPNTVTSYKVTYAERQSFTFNIVIVPFSESCLKTIRQSYRLDLTKKISKIQLPSDINKFQLGDGRKERKISATTIPDLQNLGIDLGERLEIDTSDLELSENDENKFTVSMAGTLVDFSFYDEEEHIVPRKAVDVENYRRQHIIDGNYWNEKVSFGDRTFSLYKETKNYFQQETDMIQENRLSKDSDNLELPESVVISYLKLFQTLRRRRTLMSLVYWDDEIKGIVQDILNNVSAEISLAQDRIELSTSVRNITKIGEVNQRGEVVYAPFNPMLLSYQLEVETKIGREELSGTIQRKLSPLHLVPFKKREGMSFQAYYSENAPRWLVYSSVKQEKISDTSQKIITERLKDFKKHFDYLFINSHTEYQIRAINIQDEKTFLQSVVDYLIWQIKVKLKLHSEGSNSDVLNDINPVRICIVNNNQGRGDKTKINAFYKLTDKEEYAAYFQKSLDAISDLTDTKVLETLQNKINIFYGDNQSEYHITFYQFKSQLILAPYSTQALSMNYTLDGLIGGNEYTNTSSSVKTGFGTKGLVNKTDMLKFAQYWNELLVATTSRHAVMMHGQALVNNIEETKGNDGFKAQFASSNWVTLLNPKVKLDYFNNMDKNIYVIHYTDYTNSANYESITMTKKVDQYQLILSENLPETVHQRNDAEFLDIIINSFNVINGEWLLRLVSHHNQANTVKEKLSILATYKEMLGILKIKSIVWLPLSLEEILRVAGSFVGETREDSIFSAKSLGASGAISDDLLFIGLWRDNEQLKVTFLPTEVKVGKASGSTIDKADSQVNHTFKVLKQFIFDADDFKAQFYLDFFMKLFFANAAKFYSNGNMTDTIYQKLQKMREEIAQGQLKVDNSITNVYRNKFIFSLKSEEINRLLRIEKNCAWVEVPENDAFRFAGTPIDTIINQIQQHKFGFDPTKLLSNIQDGIKLLNNGLENTAVQYESAESAEANNRIQTDVKTENYEENNPQFDSKLIYDNFKDSSVQTDLQRENNDLGLERTKENFKPDNYGIEDNRPQLGATQENKTTEKNRIQSSESKNWTAGNETYRRITSTDSNRGDSRSIRELPNDDSGNPLSKVREYWKTLKLRGGANNESVESIQTTDLPTAKNANLSAINQSEDNQANEDSEIQADSTQILKEAGTGSFENLKQSATENVDKPDNIVLNDERRFNEDVVMHQYSTTNELSTDVQKKSDEMLVNSNIDEQIGKHIENKLVNNKEFNRILLGTVDGSASKAYWEYGNSQLANRHMLITGKSGQGKTYFMQTLLLEFARKHIDTLVIDYTDSYLPDQLDPILQKQAKAINQHIIKVNKLALNPFKFNDRNIGGIMLKESVNDVVSRVAEVLDFVFDLGIQQKSRLKILMNDGLEKNSKYTFSILKQQILDADNMNLYGRIQALLDVDPFSYEDTEFSWSDYFGQSGQINIIQLTSFQASVKNAIIEFILWDLFNYSQFKVDRHLTYPVFLDEVQNLSFNRDSPIFKILTEGRKFGWSGIFATQSLNSIKGEVDAIYNASEQVHFLPPESQTKAISKILSSDAQKQKYFESELTNLHKGQCIINGPVPTEDGTLRNSANIINVDSLEQRLDK